MKIKICELGLLLIYRKDKFKKVICPYTRGACSDDCALFPEPIPTYLTPQPYKESGEEDGVELALGCGGYFVCKKEDFTDLRGGASDFCLM